MKCVTDLHIHRPPGKVLVVPTRAFAILAIPS